MNEPSQDLELLKQQYDSLPYPRIPLEKSPAEESEFLFVDNLTTSYYLYQQKIVNTKDKVILDVGCGSGWTSLKLAFANPGAKIVGIDLSENSINVAKERLKYHNFENVEFHQLTIEHLTDLKYSYDYINCTDVLYFLDNPVEALSIFRSVLNPQGIIRTNLHSYYQRFAYYQCHELFRHLGLFDENPGDFEIEVVAETMKNLKPFVTLKNRVGGFFNDPNFDLTNEDNKQRVLMNHLIQCDRGYTIPQIFALLKEANLTFLSMVNWRHWNIQDLFKDKEHIPTSWELVLENITEEEHYTLFELLHPCHRLIDFWCVKDDLPLSLQSLSTWEDTDWEKAKISLHPQLKTAKVKEDLLQSIEKQREWEISKFIKLPALSAVTISSSQCAVLLLLWEKPQSLDDLAKFWLKIQPLNLITHTEKTMSEAQQEIKNLVIKLENFLYLLVELVP